MKDTNQYIIPISGLSDGNHDYIFNVEDIFFSSFENTDISKGQVEVSVTLNKTGKVIMLDLLLDGEVELPCDRCLDNMKANIDFKEKLVVEYGNDQGIGEDSIIFVAENSDHIDLKQHIFEYIMLSLPYQRIHENGSHGNNICDPEMIKRIEELSPAEEADEYIDPRWNELKKIKNGTS